MAVIKKPKSNAGKDGRGVVKEPPNQVGGNVNKCNQYGNQYGDSSKT
jgi:hypothetical protein